MEPVTIPDLSARPFQLTVERHMEASPERIYLAWTKRFDCWFAEKGTLIMQGEVDTAFFFETVHETNRHPHYGRFLRLEPDHLIELTWVTGAGGTKGAETIVRIELERTDAGTNLRLTHAGFPDEESRSGHEQAWPFVLEQLDLKLANL
ncbi:SRPBCC domain-containing protein [Paenibacillus sp. PR3]|uniref:SRPBCC domain-containing protein n=1 Tax=Paenibacillus terricola TaxID=2763503 RepID=A0ABR8MZH8_9BACL|nr:SRPBCC domain-containing protein [Paenibacillus terricola]MBD3921342.1 SRPBCC domain-containing protein [Paenibacillus terricola]